MIVNNVQFSQFGLPDRGVFKSPPRIAGAIATIMAIGVAVGAAVCLSNQIQLTIGESVVDLRMAMMVSSIAAGVIGFTTVGSLFATPQPAKSEPLHPIFGVTPKMPKNPYFVGVGRDAKFYKNLYKHLLRPKKRLTERDVAAYLKFINNQNITPVFWNEGPHHALLCKKDDNTVYYIDSAFIPGEEANREMEARLKAKFGDLQGVSFEFPSVPQQGDAINCGLFVMIYAKLFVAGISWDDISQNKLVTAGMATELRRRLAYEIAVPNPPQLDMSKNVKPTQPTTNS